MTDHFDVSTLNWIKGEIDETLRQARVALEKYVESPEDETQIHFCATHLHQVAGTLQMVELFGAGRLAAEMEKVSDTLPGMQDKGPALEALMRSILLLPDYLEVLQGGQPDSPLILLPLLNDLRRVRGDKELTTADVFQPYLIALPGPGDLPDGSGNVADHAHAQRPVYQTALLNLLKGKDVPHSLDIVAGVCAKLGGSCVEEGTQRIFWVALAIVEALREGGLTLDGAPKLLLGKIEQVIKQLAAGGEQSVGNDAVSGWLHSALYEVARADSDGVRVSGVRRAFRITGMVPPAAVMEQIRSSLGGFNADLKKTVSRDVIEDLSRIKDVLDLLGRSGTRPVSELKPVAEALSHIADVLRLIRQSDLADSLRTQVSDINEALRSGGEVTEGLLMDVAESVLSVESALSDWGTVNPLEKADDAAGQLAASEARPEAEAEHRRVIRQVMKEAKDDLVKVREAVNAFVHRPDEKQLLSETPRQLHGIVGSLSMLSYRRAAQVLLACKRFIERDLPAGTSLPPGEKLDALADAMMSVEYYLEAFVESRVHPSSVLDVAERAVATLGYPVETLEEEVPPASLASVDDSENADEEQEIVLAVEAAEPMTESPIEEAPVVELSAFAEEATAEIAPVAAPEAPVESKATAPEMDDEIVAIFIEEADEELHKIADLLPRWRSNPGDEEVLRDLRRSFHTLKGSGRLVGASALGEFSWAFEHLLNRVIEKSVPCSEGLFDLVDAARSALIELLTQFRGGPAPTADTADLIASAEVYATTGSLPAHAAAAAPEGEILHMDDPVLAEIYTKEAETHLRSLRDYIDAFKDARCRVSDALIRALHTLCGSSRTAGVRPIAELAGVMEKYAKTLQAGGVPLDSEGRTALVVTADYVDEVLAHLRGERETVSPVGALVEMAQSLLRQAESLGSLSAAGTLPAAVPEPQESPTAEPADESLDVPLLDELAGPADVTVATETSAMPAEHVLETDEGMLAEVFAEAADLADAASFETAAQSPSGEAIALPGAEEIQIDDLVSEDLPDLGAIGFVDEHVELPPMFAGLEDIADEDIVLSDVVPSLSTPSTAESDVPLAQAQLAETALVEDLLRDEMPPSVVSAPAAAAQPPGESATSPELLAVFANEAADLLNSGDELIQSWVAQPESRKPVEGLQRVLHTLKGSARWAGVTPMADLGHALESVIAAVVQGRVAVDEEVLHLTQRAQGHMEALLAQIRNGEELGRVDEIVDSLKSLSSGTNAAPIASPVREYDPDLLHIFLEEGHELLNASDETLQALAGNLSDRSLIERLQRQLHTLKGGARMAGVSEIGDLGHSLESMLSAAADGLIQVTLPMLAMMQRAQDRLAVMLEQLRNHEPLPGGEDLVSEIEALTAGKEPVAAPSARQYATFADELPHAAVVGEMAVAGADDTATPPHARAEAAEEAGRDDEQAHRDRRHGMRPQFELVRVRADLLDSMVNVAGEASIFRSRIEQQVGALGFSLEEMNQVIERLRDKLRMFDIETEAQIQSRFQETGQGYEEFDPLEFDRFTHMQQLSRSMMESLGDLFSIGSTLQSTTREAETLLAQQARVNTELQEGLMHTRMVPLVQNAPRLRRIVRQACEELGKAAELRFLGAEVEMDRHVVERIMPPLEHLLRNAVAHGIESPEEREAKGKPRAGVIVVHQVREGGEVVVKVSDDGAGINVAAVRDKAIARGLLSPAAQLADKEVMLFILESGFSTAESITQIAGRGVGMDVVNSEVKNLNGSLSIASEPGSGTTFVIRLPLTLTVSRSLLVYAGDDMYAVPLLSIEGIVRVSDAQVSELLATEPAVYNWLGHDYDVLHLATILGAGKATSVEEGEARRQSILLAHSGDHRVAIIVDGLLGSREVVIKPIGRQLASLRGLSGATILGDGRVALILELPALIRMGLARRSETAGVPDESAQAAVGARKPLVMVVDDSITVRKVTSRLLDRNDMNSVAAKDGVEALALLDDTVPDVMLLDIEMPRMDGYELATHVRNDPRLRNIPIIMITSRSGEKHRQRAMQIGVNVYMTKPFQENELLESIRGLLREFRVAASA